MYGLINKTLIHYLEDKFGEEKLLEILSLSGNLEEFFISSNTYDDQITYGILEKASSSTGMDVDYLLQEFGKYWIFNAGLKHFGSLMAAGGSNAREFLHNLPNLHNRIMLIYPHLKPPEFFVDSISDNSMLIRYQTHRQGLHYFALGLLEGIAEMFGEKVLVQMIETKNQGGDADRYLLTWL